MNDEVRDRHGDRGRDTDLAKSEVSVVILSDWVELLQVEREDLIVQRLAFLRLNICVGLVAHHSDFWIDRFN